MPKLYRYVGPEDICIRVVNSPPGQKIGYVHALEAWICQTGQHPNRAGQYAVTFVIDAEGLLRVADRGSEHVACAGGRPVLSAGEMYFRQTENGWRVKEASNQSTGYCPEPESWPAVAAALDRAGIPHPGRFTHELVFRRCPACGERSIVKDGWFTCGMCGADLPGTWNL